MEKKVNDLLGLDIFAQQLIMLISSGKKETIHNITQQMENKNVVHYLFDKYKDDLSLSLGINFPYNEDNWEEALCGYSYITENDARRKWGIVNEDEGLLLLVSLVFEILR